MKLKKRAAALVMALTLCMAAGATVNAATVSTSEFGTMTYSLSRSGATVTAVTKPTKAAPKLITKLEVQVNSTGKLLLILLQQKQMQRTIQLSRQLIIRAQNWQLFLRTRREAQAVLPVIWRKYFKQGLLCEDGFVVA